MAQLDEMRLMARVARMYYEREMRQSEIARQLGLSQATVSRLASRARDEGIVRISVNVPQGVYSDLEERIISAYDLRDAIVVDCSREDERAIQKEVGSAAAYYVESTIKPNEVIGLSSWSATLLALVDALHPVPRKADIQVVQILGGVGNPAAEVHATRLTGRFARLVNGTATFLPAPGVVGSEAMRQMILQEPYTQAALNLFDRVTLALVGIRAIEPSELLADSGNIFRAEELSFLKSAGAVGDVLLHFFDEVGKSVTSELDYRVVAMSPEQLHRVDRAVGVAGGRRKYEAIRGALRGRWINVLITDYCTAEWLIQQAG